MPLSLSLIFDAGFAMLLRRFSLPFDAAMLFFFQMIAAMLRFHFMLFFAIADIFFFADVFCISDFRQRHFAIFISSDASLRC